MREIKFRAWDSIRKKMLEWQKSDETDPDEDEWYGATWNLLYILTERHKKVGRVLMQYTGLKDKNGREIYEGDIWRSKDDETYSVEYKDSGFYPFTVPALGGYEWDTEIASEGEVIGNIYENPELLNAY